MIDRPDIFNRLYTKITTIQNHRIVPDKKPESSLTLGSVAGMGRILGTEPQLERNTCVQASQSCFPLRPTRPWHADRIESGVPGSADQAGRRHVSCRDVLTRFFGSCLNC